MNQSNPVLLLHYRIDIELIKNNAKVAALISCKIEELNRGVLDEVPHVALFGGICADIIGRPKKYVKDNSNIGDIEIIPGGCARNIMECLYRLGVGGTLLVSAVGDDLFGEMLKEWMQENGRSLRGISTVEKYHTATYMCMMQEQVYATGIADMHVIANISVDYLKRFADDLQNVKVVVLDANLSLDAMEYVCNTAKNSTIIFDPISEEKGAKILERNLLGKINLLKGNKNQLKLIVSKITGKSTETFNNAELVNELFNYTNKIADSRLSYIILTKNNTATLGCMSGGSVKVSEKISKEIPAKEIVKTGGAGDAFMGGFIYGLLKGYDVEKNIEIGMKCAAMSIVCKYNINPELTIEKIQ